MGFLQNKRDPQQALWCTSDSLTRNEKEANPNASCIYIEISSNSERDFISIHTSTIISRKLQSSVFNIKK